LDGKLSLGSTVNSAAAMAEFGNRCDDESKK